MKGCKAMIASVMICRSRRNHSLTGSWRKGCNLLSKSEMQMSHRTVLSAKLRKKSPGYVLRTWECSSITLVTVPLGLPQSEVQIWMSLTITSHLIPIQIWTRQGTPLLSRSSLRLEALLAVQNRHSQGRRDRLKQELHIQQVSFHNIRTGFRQLGLSRKQEHMNEMTAWHGL